MGISMTNNASNQIKGVREQLDAGDRGGTPADRALLLEFSDRLRLLAEDYTDNRHIKLLRHLMRLSEEVDADADEGVLTDALENRDVAEDAVRWIHANYDNPETNRDYRVSLRVLGKHVGDCETTQCDDNGIPLSISWISSKTPRSYDPTPNPAEIVTWDEVEAMIDVARNPRDAAMVALMMDAGPRGGEFYDLRKKDLTDAEHGLQVWVDGKTGQRSVTLIPSVPQVRRWLSDHPGETDDYLWSGLTSSERISRQRVYQILRKLAERADVTKDVTPTAFRKANATWLAKTGANAALIERRQGRTTGSKAVARYIAEFGEQTEQSAYAQLHGRDVEHNDPERRDVVYCPRCEKENPPTEDLCMWCGQGLDPTGAAEAEATEREVREALAKLDPETADRFVDTMELIDETPELRAVFRAARD